MGKPEVTALKLSGDASATDRTLLASSAVIALALGAGLSAWPAEASVIVTQFAPGTVLNTGNSLGFGIGGNDDFFAAQITVDFSIPGVTNPAFLLAGNDDNQVAVKDSCTAPGCLLPLHGGEIIDGSRSFANSDVVPNIFVKGDSVYFGLDFVLDDGEHYGWLNASFDPDLGLPTLEAWAYETEAGTGITIPAPEPGSLSLLAFGAAAVLARRRRQRSKAA